ncbi:hypothetical protein Taro_044147 [Colocasia esculenta]|uniref:Uncharacterized protein n=1 Tax=Colocasia esculenta TaxID=4460 RepID=A0A843X526_COLES|nr:hypothetical protein [Colocasia esculenta]
MSVVARRVRAVAARLVLDSRQWSFPYGGHLQASPGAVLLVVSGIWSCGLWNRWKVSLPCWLPLCCWGVCCRCCVFGLVCLCAVVRCARDAELSRCFVCRVAPLVERCDTRPFRARFCCCCATSESEMRCWFGWCVLEGFSQSGALVVLVEVLPGPACVASAVLLTTVSFLMVRVVWLFRLCILVKVLPRIALCRFWWRFFPGVLCVCFGPPLCCPCGSKCAVWLGCVLVRFSQDGSWRFWWRFSPKLLRVVVMSCRCLPVGLSVLQSAWALSVKVLCAWPCVWPLRWPAGLCSRPCQWTLCIPGVRAVSFVFGDWRALADGGLVSAVGARLAVLLVEAPVLQCGFPLARGRDSLRCVSPSSVFRWLLEVVMLHCGVFRGAHRCDLSVELSSLELFWVELLAPLVSSFLYGTMEYCSVVLRFSGWLARASVVPLYARLCLGLCLGGFSCHRFSVWPLYRVVIEVVPSCSCAPGSCYGFRSLCGRVRAPCFGVLLGAYAVVMLLKKLSVFRVLLLWVSGRESPSVGPVSSWAGGAVACAVL